MLQHFFRVAIVSLMLSQGAHGQGKPIGNESDVPGTWSTESLSKRIADGETTVELHPYEGALVSLGWSPKGTKFELQPVDDSASTLQTVLEGEFAVGEQARFRVQLGLDHQAEENPSGEDEADSAELASAEAHGKATLAVDVNGNGKFEASEEQPIAPSISRGKVWYSTQVDLLLPASEAELKSGQRTRKYSISLWFVKDPAEPDEQPVMRWSIKSWHSGIVSIGDDKMMLVVSDSNKDGVYTKADDWGLIPTSAKRTSSRDTSFRVSSHAWMQEIPYRLLGLDRYGRSAVIQAFDLGLTRAEEEVANDPYAEDKRQLRAAKPVVFLDDFDEAIKLAAKEDKLVFVDFVTTWCGPCRVMDQLVYTARPTVNSCDKVICVKLDGDEQKELAKKLEVKAFPTMLLLSPQEKIIDRRTGYQSVKRLCSWIDEAVAEQDSRRKRE